MSDEQQDSFELFADTLTITLACIIFIALLLATITRSNQMDQGGLFHLERRSELVSKQIEIASKQVRSTEQKLDLAIQSNQEATVILENYEEYALAQIKHYLAAHETTYANALLSENSRNVLFATKLPWLSQTIQENTQSLNQRIARSFAEAAKQPIALSVLRERDKVDSKPIYWIISQGKLHPVRGGPTQKSPHIEWSRVEQPTNDEAAQKWLLTPNAKAGLSLEDGLQQLTESAALIPRQSGYQMILLVYADSFPQARATLRQLSSMDVNFSWRPLTMNQRILMSKNGLPPDAPF